MYVSFYWRQPENYKVKIFVTKYGKAKSLGVTDHSLIYILQIVKVKNLKSSIFDISIGRVAIFLM